MPAALTPPCLQRVFAFAGDNTVDAELRLPHWHQPHFPRLVDLQRFAQVSKSWRSCADDFRRLRRDAVLSFAFVCSDVLASVRALQVELHSRSLHVTELRLALHSDDESASNNGSPLDPRRAFESAPIDWWSLFSSHCANLSCLDLSGLPLHSRHLQAILDAASTHCPQIIALLLPDKEPDVHTVRPEVQTMFNHLYAALERWHVTGGGLHYLSVPRRIEDPADQFPQRTDEYLTAVACFCPDIEYLDGWKATYEETEYIECEEMLFCNSAAWTAFCKSCTRLREINWFTVPFASEFFRTFAQHPKSLLTKLTLAGDPPDKWADDLVDGSYYNEGGNDGNVGFAFTKDDVALVLNACPALRDLTILLYNSVNELVTQDLFDDAFLLKLAAQCPRLERFSFNELESGQPITENSAITDAGLRALASLPDIAHVYLKQTRCTGHGAFAFVDLMRRPQRCRRVELGVGNCDRSDFDRFYTLLVDLLSCFDACNEEKFRSHRFELRVFRQWVARDSVVQGGRELVLRFGQLVRSLRSRYEPLFNLTIEGDSWDARFGERTNEELDASLGTARVFVLSSVQFVLETGDRQPPSHTD